MFKFMSKRNFISKNETQQQKEFGFIGKFFNRIRNTSIKTKLKLTPPLHLRIKFRNLLPNRYPLTSILIGLNIYK